MSDLNPYRHLMHSPVCLCREWRKMLWIAVWYLATVALLGLWYWIDKGLFNGLRH